MEKRFKKAISQMLVTAMLATCTLLAWQYDCHARTFMCYSNPDYFSKRCTIHPYAITKVVDGKAHKGHLVGCQFKSYTCLDGICRDNYGPAQVPFNFSMDDLKGFCYLLCQNPPCLTTPDPNSGWQ